VFLLYTVSYGPFTLYVK